MPDFIPRKDITAATWGKFFAEKVAADWQRFNLQADDVVHLVQTAEAFSQAIAIVSAPGTRTSVAVIAKNNARAAFERVARPIAAMIRAQSNDDRTIAITFGLGNGPGRSGRRRRARKPNTMPKLTITKVDGSRLTISLRNVDRPSHRSMDADISGAFIYAYFGKDYPADIREWRQVYGTSRALKTIDLGGSHRPGAQVWITARWRNPRGEMGPRAVPVMTFLGYCGSIAA